MDLVYSVKPFNNNIFNGESILIDFEAGDDFDIILETYGLENVTIICLEYIKGIPKNMYFDGNPSHFTSHLEQSVRSMLRYIENDSKEEFPQLWI